MTTATATAPTPPAARPAGRQPRVGWVPWIVLGIVVLAGLLFGSLSQGKPSSEQRALDIAKTIRCPSCESQAVASSDTPASQAVRVLIRRRIAAGDSDEEIRDFVDGQYPGQHLLLDPSGSGFTGLVWALPVVVVVVAIAGLTFRFRDWRPGSLAVTDADRQVVADALASSTRPPEPEADAP